MVKNYLAMLGFPFTEGFSAGFDSRLKARYRELAKLIHPDRLAHLDKTPPSLSLYYLELMTELNEAYHILSHPQKRLRYLAELSAAAHKGHGFEKTSLEVFVQHHTSYQRPSEPCIDLWV